MSESTNPIKRHPLIAFFVLAYAVAWGFVPFGSFGAFGPLVAALIVIPLSRGRSGLRELGARLIRWRVGWLWYAIALVVPLAVHLATAGLTVATGGTAGPFTFSSVTTFLLVFALRLVNPTDGPLGEEPGWRGFALPGLQERYSPLLSTAILALLVAGWHVPLFFLEDGGLEPRILVGGLVTTVAVTFWYAWLFNRTGGACYWFCWPTAWRAVCRLKAGSTWASGARSPSGCSPPIGRRGAGVKALVGRTVRWRVPLSPLIASLIIGVLWRAWHLPTFLHLGNTPVQTADRRLPAVDHRVLDPAQQAVPAHRRQRAACDSLPRRHQYLPGLLPGWR